MNYELWKVLSDNKDNPVARFFLEKKNIHKFDTDSILRDEEFLKSIITIISQPISDAYVRPELETQAHLLENADLRFEYLIVDGFKAIPYSFRLQNNPEQSFGPYGIALNSRLIPRIEREPNSQSNKKLGTQIPDENNCDSFVLLGNNGSGKTSLYSAIELLCKGKIASEIKHREDVKDHRRELRHHINEPEGIQYRFNIKLKTKDNQYGFLQYISLIKQNDLVVNTNPNDNNKFISEVDLSQFFCSESDLTLIECATQTIDEYVNEICGLGDLRRAKYVCNKLIERDRDLRDKDEEKKQLSIIIEHVINLERVLGRSIETYRRDILSDAQYILKTLLEDFEDKNVELDSDNGVFNGKLRIIGKEEQILPRGYYNNFRFKLYLLSLRIGLAFTIMRRRNIQFPLIFDDVFDSSDFPNRVYTKKFFSKIISLYSSLKISNKLLQIIFFTQDEVIAESVYHGICSVTIDSKNKKYQQKAVAKGNVILGRIFNANDSCEADRVIVSADNSFINLFDIIKISKYNLVDEN